MKSVFSAFVFLLISTQAHAAEYLVKYKNQKAFARLQEMAATKSTGVSVLDVHQPGSFVVVDIQAKSEAAVVGELLSEPGIEWVNPNFELKAFETPFDKTKLKEQWGMAKVQAQKAWERAGNRGSRNVIVAVIDTGVDYRHKNLAANSIPGYDFNSNDEDPMDEVGRANKGHGTHCAGVIGATGVVEDGVVGLSPDVSIMPVRFLGANGSGNLADGIKAIDFAIEKGAHVISASWGASVRRATATALIEAVKRASDKGVIFVVAAANDGRSNDKTDVFPANANFENTITVAASNSNDGKPSWSNYGKAMVHIASPGEGIMSTIPNDEYVSMSGTSMATPLVAGAVALLKAQDPTLTGAQIRALLQTTGVKASIETACNCRIDAFAAVDHLLSRKPWMVPAATTMSAKETQNLTMMNANGAVTYASSNPAVLTVDANGVVTAVAKGTAQITATDAAGRTASTLDFDVKAGGAGKPECPVSSETICRGICWLFPRLGFCQ
ncbi:MAG: S8 family serine peptidase [Bdellovibrionaceae bacterium]|nr:S8 family serine peptidase [Pseudobdellovibrionaceae bacterium]